ncbi:beta-ketoacyl-ACP synthase III [Streptomyces sp. NPDC058623]|uniref:beta-ketoacyl-ACP synthase III n=1 Tax=Streptomyces sp. NPDC058623 TaxID=3346563 RepID=UPI003661572F
MTGNSAVLSGIGAYLPPRVVSNAELADRLGITDDWIHRRTGIRRRHVCDPGTATSDLAVEAGARALASAGLESVGAVVLATATPDYQIPATAPVVAARLGLGDAAAFDVNAVCTGFLYGLATGAGLIGSGIVNDVLVIGADAFSTVTDPDDAVVRPLFGDGAGAFVLRAGGPAEAGALTAFDLGSDGHRADLIISPGSGARHRSHGAPVTSASHYMTMRGREVFVGAVRHMTRSSGKVLASAGLTAGEVDHLVGHQANIRILNAVADQLGLPADRLVSNIDRVGNTSAASIPLALADAVAAGQVRAGEVVLLTAFGAGLTWGSTVLTWPKID